MGGMTNHGVYSRPIQLSMCFRKPTLHTFLSFKLSDGEIDSINTNISACKVTWSKTGRPTRDLLCFVTSSTWVCVLVCVNVSSLLVFWIHHTFINNWAIDHWSIGRTKSSETWKIGAVSYVICASSSSYMIVDSAYMPLLSSRIRRWRRLRSCDGDCTEWSTGYGDHNHQKRCIILLGAVKADMCVAYRDVYVTWPIKTTGR
jgi:hypothetical protein